MSKIQEPQIIHRDPDLQMGRSCEELLRGWEVVQQLSRRRFLQGGSAALGGMLFGGLGGFFNDGAQADDAVATGKFIFPRLQFSVKDRTPDLWDVSPIGDVNLRKKLKELTNINISMEPKVVRLDDFDDMVRHPFVFMTSEGYFKLPDNEERNFREFLERGGFVLADDCVYNMREDRFFKDYLKLINRLFPKNPMRKIPNDHEIFHIYYKMKDGSPHLQGVNHGAYGLFEPGTGRIMTICTPGDIHCGWCMKYFTLEQNVEAIKMGINIIIYFLSH